MAEPQSTTKVINLAEYSLPQLENMNQALLSQREQFLSMLTTMQDTNEKAEKAIEALGCMKPGNESNDILIPVSANILVPGKLDNVEHVYVSVGTGYVVEKTVDDATSFFSNQTNMLSGSIKAIRSQAMSIEDQLVPLQRMIEIRKQQQAEASKSKQ